MRIRRRSTRWLEWNATAIAAAALLTFSGCGDGLAHVSGSVTLDGNPLRGGDGVRGTVYFQPVSDTGTAAVGILDEEGQYRLSSGSREGVEPGQYVVTCTATEIIPPTSPGGTPSGKRTTPQKYASARTSGFQFTVEPGGNECNLALTSVASAMRPGRGQ